MPLNNLAQIIIAALNFHFLDTRSLRILITKFVGLPNVNLRITIIYPFLIQQEFPSGNVSVPQLGTDRKEMVSYGYKILRSHSGMARTMEL